MAALDGFIGIATKTQVLYGGYGRALGGGIKDGNSCTSGNCFVGNCDLVEAIDGSCGPAGITESDWETVDASGSRVSYYTFRNSNSLPGRNSQSSLATVEVLNQWNAEIGTDNKIIFNLMTRVTRVTTTDVKPGMSTSIPEYKFAFGANDGSGKRLSNIIPYSVISNWDSQVSAPEISSEANTLYTRFELGAQETTERGQILFQSWSGVNGSSWNTGNILWRDGFVMGALFRNNLPNYYSPPSDPSITQKPNICDETVSAVLCFPQPVISGAKLELDWSYEPDSFPATNRVTSSTINDEGKFCVTLRNLVPTTCEPSKVYWRARFVSQTGAISSSTWKTGVFEVMFVPPAWMTVPDISTPECTAVGKGDALEPYDEIVYYANRKPGCKKGKC